MNIIAWFGSSRRAQRRRSRPLHKRPVRITFDGESSGVEDANTLNPNAIAPYSECNSSNLKSPKLSHPDQQEYRRASKQRAQCISEHLFATPHAKDAHVEVHVWQRKGMKKKIEKKKPASQQTILMEFFLR